MKTFIYLILLLFFSCSLNSSKNINKKWNDLLNSKTIKEEKEQIIVITNYITRLNGHFNIYGIKNRNEINMFSKDFNLEKTDSFNIIINWDDKEFKGKNWKPIKKENVYDFFLE